jgi:cellobiose phosphorylase
MGDYEKTWELIQMINPINHGSNVETINAYQVEPYVMAADVYGMPLHKGRGGWTWYTGSAGWMYQLILESFIGLKKEGSHLHFKPRVPAAWQSFTITYRYMDTTYIITCNRTAKNSTEGKLLLDGNEQESKFLLLSNDGQSHAVDLLF